MFSCVNQQRGCRGRTNDNGGKCESCRQLNLKRPSSLSVFGNSGIREFSRPVIDLASLEAVENANK